MNDLVPASLGLSRVKLLGGVDAATLEGLARQCSWRRYDQGQTMISREALGGEVYLIIAGRVRVTIYTASGRQVTFRDMAEGDSVGEVSAIDGGRRSADVVALSEVVVAALPQPIFRRLLLEQPHVAERFMFHLAQLIRLLSEKVIELSTLGVQNRIHADLLRLVRESHRGAALHQCRITPAPKHAEIASRVSTTREQVTRELSALTRRGLVVKDAKGLLVTDVDLLVRLVERASLDA